MPKIDVLLHGFRFNTDVGIPGFCSVLLIEGTKRTLVDVGHVGRRVVLENALKERGLTAADIDVVVMSHAHWDHVEGHAAMKELTGAQVMAVGEDAAAIGSGIDSSAAGAQGWNPVRVDRVLEDLDTISLGGVTMQAHLTPGHTKGCTAWTLTVEENGKSYSVVFVRGTGINRGVNLLNNKRHPSIVEDYARTFQVLKEIEADVYLAQHPSMYGMDEKLEQLRGGATGNPFIDPEGYRRFLEEEEGNYLKKLEEERSASR